MNNIIPHSMKIGRFYRPPTESEGNVFSHVYLATGEEEFLPPPSDTIKLVQYEAWAVEKWVVGIRLKCLIRNKF